MSGVLDDEDGDVHCLGKKCFAVPHEDYKPPSFYNVPLLRGERVPGRDYRWLVSANLKNTAEPKPKRGLRLAVFRAVSLPECLGLSDDGRWVWQHLPLSFLAGVKLNLLSSPSSHAKATQPFLADHEGVSHLHPGSSSPHLWLEPRLRMQFMSPLLGDMAVKCSVDLLPHPCMHLRRTFTLGTTKLSLRAKIQPSCGRQLSSSSSSSSRWPFGFPLPSWTLQVDWRPADSARIQQKQSAHSGTSEERLSVKYTRGISFTKDCHGVVAGSFELPTRVSSSSGLAAFFPRRIRLESLKITQHLGLRPNRVTPASTRRHLRASHKIGQSDVFAVVPGHWIDPGFEPGAPGEREFNLQVANALEDHLRSNGWEVLRPDRDAPNLQWEHYINWVAKQTLKGMPLIEIHGQGSNADYRGFVLGVIGDKNAPLNKELCKTFGHFQMDWRELAVPRRGGVIVESFNSDEVLEMAPWHRAWAVNRLASRIATCVERASASNRKARGIEVLPIKEDESPWDEEIMPEPSTPTGMDTPRSARLPDTVWTYPEVVNKAQVDEIGQAKPWLQVGFSRFSNLLRGGTMWWARN